MLHLDTAGSPYEIGRQHGAADPEAVRLAYAAWVSQAPGLAPEGATSADQGIRTVESRLDRFFPETLEEMRGIAAGSGVPYHQILTLNCFDAIIGAGRTAPGCSTIGFADSDAGVLLGKTADWNVAGAEEIALWQRFTPAPGGGHAFVHYGCAGTLWTEGGLNDAGLGMVLNGLPVAGLTRDSVPWPALTRGVLQHAADVRAAIDFLSGYDVMCWGFNLILADAAGDLAFIEVVPGAQAVRRPAADYLIHTNHCLCPQTQGGQLDETALAQYGEAGLSENSLQRYHTLERIAPSSPRTLAGMQAILADRSIPGAISQRGEHGQHTVYAMIIAPALGTIWGAEGWPPDVPFVAYRV